MTEVGANDAVTSEGNPEMLRFTTPVKPFTALIVTVSVPVELRFTVIVRFRYGDGEIRSRHGINFQR